METKDLLKQISIEYLGKFSTAHLEFFYTLNEMLHQIYEIHNLIESSKLVSLV